MAQPEITQTAADNLEPKAQWQDSEVDILLQHFIQNHAAIGDSGNFSGPTFNSAATAINSDETIQTMGPPKTGNMVKTKWTALKKYSIKSRPTAMYLAFIWTMCGELGLRALLLTVFGIHMLLQGGACGRHAFHPATTAPASIDVDIDDVLDGGLALLDVDGGSTSAGATGPSDVPDMSADLMMPPSAPFLATSTATGSQSSKRVHTNTLLNSMETSSYNSGGTPMSSYADSPQSSSLPLSSTLAPLSQPLSQPPALKKARVSMHGSSQTGVSSTAKVAAKVTPAATVMNMQGTINRLTDVIERNMMAPSDLPVVVVPTMISCGLSILRGADGDLPVAQRANLLQILLRSGGKNNLAVYVGLEDNFEMHRAFILRLLGSIQ
ncbi:hypothetical protein DFJ58DRAFT_721749 [Suillus subalutaceus]|uniref:uncharacterized protein n=1 Tax=Suillus subalutaceus TaxID=48586 RepID=UPI001B880BE4|nr:uncharacterized protein DFJ58DRAFT_721749 [Suillus subalutaceus]KAG1874754.1 hypothetical protein DFJ58DRAFT_721749 [Suillus subalutaceus]